MILLLDGVNKTGKSTLARRIMADVPHFRYLHFDAPRTYKVYQFFMDRLEEVDGLDIILDRLHLSNAAFRDLLGGSVLADFDWWRIDQWVAQRPSVALLMVDDPHAILPRVEADLEARPWLKPLATAAAIGQVQNRFYQCFDRSAISPKWALGLDQLLDLDADPPAVTETYQRLLSHLKGESP